MVRAPAADTPASNDLTVLRDAAAACVACELAGPATQTVFGEGPPGARLVLVGEQPGDQEDRRGHPFVGPAGRLLDDALTTAGIERDSAYVTNAVKHFRFEHVRNGTLRLHRNPTATQVRICRPWLDAELRSVRPDVVIALGATAAKALRGSDFRITASRGEILAMTDPIEARFLATAHPSAVLRADDRDEAFAALVADLRIAAAELAA